jgi:hypothetical protein
VNGGAIAQLQRDAMESKRTVSDVLRRALVIARKLGLKEFDSWVNLELNGYSSVADLPGYRLITGTPTAINAASGRLVHMTFGDAEARRDATLVKVTSPATDLENLASSKEKRTLVFNWPSGQAEMYERQNPTHTQPSTIVSRAQLAGILERIRNQVLNLTLQLEEAGVSGEGLQFTEREKAAALSQYFNVYGPANVANINCSGDHANINVTVEAPSQAMSDFVKNVRGTLDHLGLELEENAELDADLKTLEAQIVSPKPKQSILRSSLQSVLRVLEGAAGSALAGPLVHAGQEILKQLK